MHLFCSSSVNPFVKLVLSREIVLVCFANDFYMAAKYTDIVVITILRKLF